MNNDLNISPEEWEHIEKFLSGDLPDDILAQTQERIHTDKAYAAKVEEVRLTVLAIQETSLTASLSGFRKADEVRSGRSRAARSLTLKKILVAAAILLLAVTGLWLILQPPRHTKLYTEYFKPDPGLPTTMGVSDNYEFDKAMVEYKTGNYETAAQLWEKLQGIHPDNDTLNYFTGIALLSDHGGSRCIPFFDRVIASNKPAFLNDAYWYKGMALLKQDNTKEAAIYIEKSGTEKAASLLEKLQ